MFYISPFSNYYYAFLFLISPPLASLSLIPPQIIGAGHAFLSFIASTWNTNLKILATTNLQQIHGTVNSSKEFLLTVWPKQSVTQLGWISVLISSQPTTRSKNRNPQKFISYYTKNQYSKKNFESASF